MTRRVIPWTFAALVLLVTATGAGAQVVTGGGSTGGVGSGPLTGSLSATPPTSALFDFSWLKLSPGVTIHSLGHDSNVFNERDTPEEDNGVQGTLDLSMFGATRWAQIAAYVGSDLTYFQAHRDERSRGYQYRARIDTILSRFRPYVGAGITKHRERPNGEIDTRTDREEQEVSGGVAFELGPYQQIYAGATKYNVAYLDAFEDGVVLATSLNHGSTGYTLGVKTDLTPITAVVVSGAYQKDRFEGAPLRNSASMMADASLRMGAEAAVSGVATVGYRLLNPKDPLVKRHSGATASLSLTYPFLEIGRLSWSLNRNLEYSFDEAEAYYEETSVQLSYTQRLIRNMDAQVRGAHSRFNYNGRVDEPQSVKHIDRLDTLGGSVGYRLRNQTRIAVNYEYSRRRSPAFADRNYVREQIYLSWLYGF